ncbi:hypothetical protein KIF24_10935 [Micromonospora sp. Llam7]|uniref:MobC family plasmid mobilization relaxosome protein n=1 Tax=Micromonospora tarapacensis TaxID=2835305 RepID=UPI001C839692|nr:MobC family plasmid mobilization relaxosome protein [Micromonospora tarapacensis]MBX7266494.1 hypothetical protein [Micromonospora tarapacensis]
MDSRTAHHTAPRARAGRDRDHLFPRRVRRAGPSFHDDEWAAIAAAAEKVDLTPTGFIAQAAYAHARGECATTGAGSGGDGYEVLRQLLGELFETRTALNRVGTNLNQAVAAFNSTGEAPVWLADAVRLVTRAVTSVDETAAGVGRRLP